MVEISEMPIYEYRCDNCGHELEAFQMLNEDPLKQCPKCDTDNLIKKISAAGFRLKGGGWYETDFKKGNKKNVAGGDAAAENKSGDSGKSDSGSDSSGSSSSGASESSTPSKSSSGSGD